MLVVWPRRQHDTDQKVHIILPLVPAQLAFRTVLEPSLVELDIEPASQGQVILERPGVLSIPFPKRAAQRISIDVAHFLQKSPSLRNM